MNTHSRPPADSLAELLDRWGRPPACPPLSVEVRRRVRQASPPRDAAEGLRLFTRPAFAALFVAACVTLGLFLAELRVTEQHRTRDAQLLASYRQLIDPLLTVEPAPAEFHPDARP